MGTSFMHARKDFYQYSFMAVLVLLPWSLQLASYAIAVMIIAGLLSNKWVEKKNHIPEHPQFLVFILFFLLYLLGLLYSHNFYEGLHSIDQKLPLVIFPIIAVISSPIEKNNIKRGAYLFALSNFVFTICFLFYNVYLITSGNPYLQVNFDPITMANFLTFHPEVNPAWLRLSYIAFSNAWVGPTYLSMYLTFSVLIFYYHESTSRFMRGFRNLAMAWLTIAVVLLASRMGIFVFILVCSLNLIYHLATLKYSASEITARVSSLFVVIILLVIASPVTRFRLIEEPLSTPLEIPSNPKLWNSVNLRFLEWSSGLKSIKANSFMGTGTGGVLSSLKQQYHEVDLGSFESNYNAHNQYIETLLELGIPGILTLLLCFLLPLVFAIKRNNLLLISLILITSLTCFSTSVFEWQRGLVFYMSFVSFFMFTNSQKEKDESSK